MALSSPTSIHPYLGSCRYEEYEHPSYRGDHGYHMQYFFVFIPSLYTIHLISSTIISPSLQPGFLDACLSHMRTAYPLCLR